MVNCDATSTNEYITDRSPVFDIHPPQKTFRKTALQSWTVLAEGVCVVTRGRLCLPNLLHRGGKRSVRGYLAASLRYPYILAGYRPIFPESFILISPLSYAKQITLTKPFLTASSERASFRKSFARAPSATQPISTY